MASLLSSHSTVSGQPVKEKEAWKLAADHFARKQDKEAEAFRIAKAKDRAKKEEERNRVMEAKARADSHRRVEQAAYHAAAFHRRHGRDARAVSVPIDRLISSKQGYNKQRPASAAPAINGSSAAGAGAAGGGGGLSSSAAMAVAVPSLAGGGGNPAILPPQSSSPIMGMSSSRHHCHHHQPQQQQWARAVNNTTSNRRPQPVPAAHHHGNNYQHHHSNNHHHHHHHQPQPQSIPLPQQSPRAHYPQPSLIDPNPRTYSPPPPATAPQFFQRHPSQTASRMRSPRKVVDNLSSTIDPWKNNQGHYSYPQQLQQNPQYQTRAISTRQLSPRDEIGWTSNNNNSSNTNNINHNSSNNNNYNFWGGDVGVMASLGNNSNNYNYNYGNNDNGRTRHDVGRAHLSARALPIQLYAPSDDSPPIANRNTRGIQSARAVLVGNAAMQELGMSQDRYSPLEWSDHQQLSSSISSAYGRNDYGASSEGGGAAQYPVDNNYGYNGDYNNYNNHLSSSSNNNASSSNNGSSNLIYSHQQQQQQQQQLRAGKSSSSRSSQNSRRLVPTKPKPEVVRHASQLNAELFEDFVHGAMVAV